MSTMEPLDPLSVDNRYARVCSAATLQSEPKGFFGELVNNLEAAVGPSWLAEMANLKTDEDKIRFCQRRSEIRESLCGVQPVFRHKDAAMADRLLREASSALQRGDHAAALPLLNRAAVRSPTGPSLGAVLWTRSGALIAAGNWAAGKADVETALTQGLPDQRRGEAFVRIGRCHLALGDAARAKIALQLGKRLATERGDLALKTAAERALTKLDVGAATPPATPDGFLDGHTKDPLLPIPIVRPQTAPEHDATILTVTSAPGAGRFLAAARDVRPGETLLVEKSLAVVPLPNLAGSRCHHCLARLEAARGCSRCSGVAYCSAECSSAAERYHRTECQFLGLLEGSGASALTSLALRLITQKPIAFFQRLSTKDSKDIDEDVQAYEKILCLEGHDTLRPHGEILHRAVMTLLLLRILQQSSYFTQPSNPLSAAELSNDECTIGGILLRLLLVLQFNAHEVCETLLPPAGLRLGKSLPLAVAVYPRASLFNHSCNPNVTRYFVGTTLVAASTRHLNEGAVAADSYGAQFSRQGLGERRRWLASRYWFVCACEACKGCWPTTAGLIENNAEHARSQIEEAHEALNSENPEKATAILVDLLETIRDSASPPPRWAMEAQDALRACLASKGNTHRVPSKNISAVTDLTVATLAI